MPLLGHLLIRITDRAIGDGGKVHSVTQCLDSAEVDEGMNGLSTRFAFKILSKVFNFDPQEIAADLIRKHAERMVLCVQLPPGDPRLPAVEALTRALAMRTFDDSAISLDACLRDVQEVGIGDQ